MNAKIAGSLMMVATLSMIGCGGSSSTPTTTATVGAAGATLKVGSAALTIPASALSSNVQITVREVEPRHAGRATRIEIEPRGTALAVPARLSVKVDDTNANVKMFDDDGVAEHAAEVELEDANHHAHKTSMTTLQHVEVEIEHLRACTPACGANQECDDGVCKAHVEDNPNAAVCDPVCAAGLECDDGLCKPHGGAI